MPLGKGIVRREGADVTIVGTLLMMRRASPPASSLHLEGISAEVIDPRSLAGFDSELVRGSVMKTMRALVEEEGPAAVEVKR